MTQDELGHVVDQILKNWKIEACIACDLRGSQVEERHRSEGPKLRAEWNDHVGFRRCTVKVEPLPYTTVAQVDLHDNGTFRSSIFVPCKLNFLPEEGLLCFSV